VLAPGPVLVVWLASRRDALTAKELVVAEASREGHRFVPAVLVLAVLTAAAAVLLGLAERRVPDWRAGRVAYAAALWALVIAVAVGVFARYGAPWDIAERGYRAFVTRPSAAATPSPAPAQPADLNERLFSFWGNGRAEAWRVAWEDIEAEPVLGTGAGTYELSWNRERPFPSVIQDAHSLYVEALAELGPVGLVLLLAALGTPLVAAVRARRRPLVTAAFGAYVLYVVHAAADWDWELTALTLTALFLAAALFASARERPAAPLATPLRIGALVLTLAAVAFAFVALISNTALADARRALEDEDYARAEQRARKATSWAPWSAQGWEALADAQLQQGKVVAARRSYRKAIAKDSRDWHLWLKLAFASSGRARQQAALVASRLNPLSPELEQAHLELPKG
jgi:O-Antigen ligase